MSFVIQGVRVSEGVAQGLAFVISEEPDLSLPLSSVTEDAIPGEVERFLACMAAADRDLEDLEKCLRQRLGPGQAEIIGAQRVILADIGLQEGVVNLIRDQLLSAESAILEITARYSRRFLAIEDPYLREREADVRDLGKRLLALLLQQSIPDPWKVPEGAIVVTREVLPSAAASLDSHGIRGLVSETGGANSHAAILARALGCPAITGAAQCSSLVRTGDYVVLDGSNGQILINPPPLVVEQYRLKEAHLCADRDSLKAVRDCPGLTLDGTHIVLQANIGKVGEAHTAAWHRADGVGLFRTEFCFSISDRFPTEAEQYQLYRSVSEAISPGTVTFRLLDIGADKHLPYFPIRNIRNPSLGLRGLRVLLKHPEVARTQLRAILRVGREFPVSVLIPMVTDEQDAVGIRNLFEAVCREVQAEGALFPHQIPMGAMLEVPSAALTTRQLSRHFDFFSLGTNDLVQYLQAADRENEETAGYFDPVHPGVLQVIDHVVAASRTTGCPLSICGEMAGEPLFVPLLLGLGLRTFSVSPSRLLDVKRVIRATPLAEAESLARSALDAVSSMEIHQLLSAFQQRG